MYFKDIKMLQRTKIVKVLASERPLDEVLVKGWVRTRRDAKDFSFIELNDGSCLKIFKLLPIIISTIMRKSKN